MTNPEGDLPAEQPKRRRSTKKWASAVARQQHADERRKLLREASEHWERQISEARGWLVWSETRQNSGERNKRRNMVIKAMRPRLMAVMNSWGINLPVAMDKAPEPSAWTNFETINVCYDERVCGVETNAAGDPIPVPDELIAAIAVETRGLFYHELGHNLFTVPLHDLLFLAVEEGGMPARGITRELAEGLVYLVTQQTQEQKNSAGHKVTVPILSWEIDPRFHKAWNTLEDQRMEMALVNESPQLARYLTVMINRLILDMTNASDGQSFRKASKAWSWGLVAGRTYLPDSLRLPSKALWDAQVNSVDSDTVAGVVQAYSQATTATQMIQAVVSMVDILDGIEMPALDDHENMPRQISGAGHNKAGAKNKLDRTGKGSKAADEKCQGKGESKEGQGGGDSKNDSKSLPGGNGAGQNNGETPDDAFDNPFTSITEEKVADAWKAQSKETIEELMAKDSTTQEDIKAINEAYNTDDGKLPTILPAGYNTDENDLVMAAALADDVETAFRAATQDAAPHWAEGQRRGVLNAVRYTTRQPGDMEIFRTWADHGEPGHDIAVTLFLDVSGSMGHMAHRLGVATYSIKEACRRLGIKCDVYTFSSGGYTLYMADEVVDEVPVMPIFGGTNPKEAFETILQEERSEVAHHLVMVMTDGEWAHQYKDGGDKQVKVHTTMHPYGHPNMTKALLYFVPETTGSQTIKLQGVRYEVESGCTPRRDLAELLGADEGFVTHDLYDMPRIVESIILDFV